MTIYKEQKIEKLFPFLCSTRTAKFIFVSNECVCEDVKCGNVFYVSCCV